MAELEQEIVHLKELQAKHRKNIHTLEEMLANYGMDRPLHLLNSLEFEQEQLCQVEGQLTTTQAAQAKTEEFQVARGVMTMEVVNDYLARAVAAYEARMYQLVARPAVPFDQPYKFLYAFEIEDADIFFGRDAGSKAFYQTILKDRLTILHAKSGAGKTSLLNAGLSPHLIREGRLPVCVRAYEDPVLAIKRAIAPSSLGPWPELLARLTLHEFLGLTCARLSRQTQELVIILDQFEEFFIFWPEQDHRQPFIDTLADCYDDKVLPVRFIIALRKDYYSDLAAFQRRLPHIFHNEYYLEAMARQGARAAVTGPVEKLGRPVAYEQALLSMLLDDLARGGMELPHLQIICTRLYETLAEGETAITLASYEKLGRAEGVLGGYLNSVLKRLPGKGWTIAREVLKELVSSEATKRVLSYSKLAARVEVERDDLEGVLTRLVDARLLRRDETADDIVYEMAHEYLIEEIEKWISSEEMEIKEAQDILRREITSWHRHGALVSPEKLKIIETYREKLGLSEEEKRILRLSSKVYGIREKLEEEDIEELAAEILETALEISNAEEGWLLTTDRLGNLVVTISGRRTESGSVQMDKTHDIKLRTEEGIIAQVLKDRNACIKNDFMSDELQLAESCPVSIKSFICVPISVATSESAWGAIGLSRRMPSSEYFSVQDANLLQSLANHASLAVQNTLLFQAFRDLEEGDKRKEREKETIIDAEREARKKLARDLHDGPTQSVAAIAMRLNYTRLLLEREPEKVKEELEKIETLARRTTKEIRTMLFTLRPVILETQGLVAALELYLKQLEEETEMAVHLEAPDLGDRLNADIEGVTFSIIEEAVNNAKKYAQARNIWVRLGFEDSFFVATVEDDGQGFDVAELLDSYDQRGSLGLINMKERAELVEGTWTIESAVGQGTKVTLIVPLTEERYES